ncbi:NAD-dependent epimerase/dehydratase family protein [Thalassospira tepidiphila]|uniref:NAD-dependent epimerase/dehydratase family protein n=1 Tax=Thalassospira tepidiphila TaxID=393657 RepID=UPI003AA7D4B2
MKNLSGKKVAIIGGGGFIGHNMALSLKKIGAEVDIVDSLQVNNLYTFSNARDEIVNRDFYIKMINERLDLLKEANIPLHLQDARDYHAMNNILNSIDPDTIIHLAAVSHANKSNKDPYSTFDHSLRTLENTLDFARNGRVQHFLFFSSSMVYGHFDKEEVDENTICNPLGIYGALKYAGEKMVIAYNQVFDLPYTIIRPSALYGERCVSRRVGQIFLENAVQGKNVTIHGDGSDCLDFTYIDDLIHGVVCALGSENAKNEIFNITYGQGRTIAEMAEMVREHFPKTEVEYISKDNLTPDRGTLNVDKARRLIGFSPSNPLEVGYPKYIEWYKSFAKKEIEAGRLVL